MRALICREWGPVESLELADVPSAHPRPGAGAAGSRGRPPLSTFADSIMVAGKYQTKPAIPVLAGAGGQRATVAAVGASG